MLTLRKDYILKLLAIHVHHSWKVKRELKNSSISPRSSARRGWTTPFSRSPYDSSLLDHVYSNQANGKWGDLFSGFGETLGQFL